MMLARVMGNVVATAKHQGLGGRTLLLIQPIARDGADRGRPLVAVDAVGAGFRETVYWCRGREASLAFDGAPVPTDAAIVGIVDAITPARSLVETQPAASAFRPPRKPKRGRR